MHAPYIYKKDQKNDAGFLLKLVKGTKHTIGVGDGFDVRVGKALKGVPSELATILWDDPSGFSSCIIRASAEKGTSPLFFSPPSLIASQRFS